MCGSKCTHSTVNAGSCQDIKRLRISMRVFPQNSGTQLCKLVKLEEHGINMLRVMRFKFRDRMNE